MVGVGTLIALSSCAGASSATPAQPAYRHYHSRPDLKPPPVEILTRTRRTTPGYIFIAPKKKVAQTGPLIVDNYGNATWFLPVETRGVTDFRVQRYQGRPVLTWWRSRSEDGDDVGRYSIYDSSYRLVKHVRPGNELTGDMHEFVITSRSTALMTLSHRVSVKGRSVLEGALQELDLRTGRVVFEWHSIDHVRLVESYYRLPGNPDRVYDYFHINSIAIDHDGNLLVSARNTHTVYKISRRTGEILWRLGGRRSDFALGPGVRFAWQPPSCTTRRWSRSTRATCSGSRTATTSSVGGTSRTSRSSGRAERKSSTAASATLASTPTARTGSRGSEGQDIDHRSLSTAAPSTSAGTAQRRSRAGSCSGGEGATSSRPLSRCGREASRPRSLSRRMWTTSQCVRSIARACRWHGRIRSAADERQALTLARRARASAVRL